MFARRLRSYYEPTREDTMKAFARAGEENEDAWATGRPQMGVGRGSASGVASEPSSVLLLGWSRDFSH
jgi:hypothetical protein